MSVGKAELALQILVIVVAFVLTSLAFSPGPANKPEVSPLTSESGSTPAISDAAPPLNGSADSPGGPSPPPGSVIDAHVSPPPIRSSIPVNELPPALNVTTSEYQYVTVSGRYTFPRSNPFLVQYSTPEGDQLVTASTFAVLSAGISLFNNVTVLNATDHRYVARYDYSVGRIVRGTVTITFDFRDDGPPKITAVRNQSAGRTLALVWATFSVDTFANNDAKTVDFRSLTPPASIATPDNGLSVGPSLDAPNWTRRMILDWRDAPGGAVVVGRSSIGPLIGSAVVVTFPSDLAIVDPILAGTSTSPAATDYSMQRKVFSTGDRFWAFWYDGTNIVYASSQFSYANAQNTPSPWTSKMTTPSGSLPSGVDYRGFDVDQRAGTVLVGYIASGLTSMKVLVGSIAGSFITWTGPFTVASWSTAEAGVPSVSIGSDGYFWAAFVWKPGGASLDRYRSNGPGSTSFSPSLGENLVGAPADSAVRLISLSNGSILSIHSTKGSSTIATRRYAAGGWGNTLIWDVKLPTLDGRGGILSAVARKDDSVYIVFKGDNTNAPGLRYVILFKNDVLTPAPPNPPGTIDSTAGPNQPTLAVDLNGDLHVFWMYVDSPSGSFRWHIRYARSPPDGGPWGTFTEPWSYSGQQRMGLTAGALATSQAFLVWSEADTSPFSVNFGGVATPMDLGGQSGQPWNRQGLSPYQSYFRQRSEFVSPGSGLLTVRQSDLVLPGRNLDLEIARILVTPRAFTAISPSPYLFEDNPAANLGKGWSLDFPWISSQYLHLPGGQMYVLRWQGNTFENHDGEHFVLTRTCTPSCSYYTLTPKSGLRYDFNPSKQLTGIRDNSSNSISFTYASGRIDHITDTVGRTVSFAYNTDGTLKSIASGPQAVSYTYPASGLTVLKSVSDSLGRTTQFDYTDARNGYLLTGITYPTGGKSAYSWSNPAITIGSDLQAYYVTLQDTLNTLGQSVRSNQISYTVVNGRVTFAKVTTYNASVAQGSTVQMFDPGSSKSATIRYDAAGLQLDKQVAWFGNGAITQVDVYPGAATTPAYSTYAAVDDWGNLIYSRDALGHERFASYVNTRYQGGFYAPGRITKSASGLLFSDDFEDRDISDWMLDGSAGAPTLNYTNFESLPPSVRVAHNGALTGVSSITHTFAAQSGDFVAEATVLAQETNKFHHVYLMSTTGSRVHASLRDNGWISWDDGSIYHDVMPYSAGQWYRLGFVVRAASSKYDVWVNGQLRASNATIFGSGNIDRIDIQASCSGCGAASMFVDNVKVYQATGLTVTGLTVGQVVTYASLEGMGSASKQVISGSSVFLTLNPGNFSRGTLAVFDRTGSLEFSSPTPEFWGGDSWAYTGPWKTSMSLTQTTSGFLRAQLGLVDDSTPVTATPVNAEDGWNWGTFFNAPSGPSRKDHVSLYLTGTHQHYYQGDTYPFAMSSGEYHIQYLYVPPGESPSEIMLQFQDSTANLDRWAHRAYWGSDLIAWGTNGTNSRRSMGGLPPASGRWLMVIVKADDVGTSSVSSLTGLAYALYGGQAAWEFSAKGDANTGRVWVGGLSQGWTIELRDPSGGLVASNVVPNGNTAQYLDLYGSIRKVNAFPFDGYIVLKDASTAAVYRSPVLSLWGGDYYTYSPTSFYANVGVDPTIHDRPAGTVEFQTGRFGQPVVPQDSYVRYNTQGLPDRSKARDGSLWRETAYTYDGTYGLLTNVTDPKSNTLSYSYSAAYSKAYVTQISDTVGVRNRYAYDPTTGWRVSGKDGRGYLSRYAYDSLGRPTEESRFDLPPSSEVLYLDMDWTTEQATPRLEDQSGRGNHGTISGPIAVPGKVGVARAFDGVDDVVTMPASSSLNTASFTAALWLNRNSFTTSQGLMGKASFPNSWRIWTRTDGKIEADAKSDAIGNLVSQTTVVAGRWYHLALTFDGTTARLYVNGIQEAQAATGDWGGAYNVAVWVGDTDSTSPFSGTIDEVRMFNTALNATTIGSLFTNAYGRLSSSSIVYDDVGNAVTSYEPTTVPRLIHYDLESVLNGKIEDLGGRGNHASNNGAAASQANCKFGGCYYFDGGDWMETADATSQRPGRISVAAWFRADDLNANHVILAKKEKSSPSTLGFALWTGVDGKVYFSVYDSARGEHRASSTNAISAATYYHVVGISNGSTVSLYLNGALQSPSASFLGDVAYTPDPLTIGVQYNLGLKDGYFKGYIDEVQVFDRGLTAAEVAALYQGTEKGFYAKQYFDSLGRGTRSVREDMFSTLRSWQTLVYNFQDRVFISTVARNSTASFATTYGYDFLGRPTVVAYPGFGNYPVTVTYDDVNRLRTVVAENGRKVQYVYDLGGRTTATREYYDPSNYYTTSYAYNEAGNLLSVTNALNQVTQHAYDNQNRLTKTTYPDTTKYETYTYDEVGNLKTKTDRAGQLTTNGYDVRYRLTSIDYGSTTPNPDVGYAYDGNDNPTTVTSYATNPATTVAYVYDGNDHATSETDTISGTGYAVGYGYDAAGRLTQLTYPDSTAISYVYDRVGRTSQVKAASATYGSFTYSADDLTNNVTFGNGVVRSYAYNGRGWPTSIKATYQPTTYLDLGYSYDSSGNPLTMGSASFTYDKLDRLLTGSGGFGSQAFSYDATGNRLWLDRNATTVVLRPDGASSPTGWTPVGCSPNWQCVDEVTSDGDVTRVESTTPGNVDMYSIQDLAPTSRGIAAVTVTAVAKFFPYAGPYCRDNPCYGSIALQLNGFTGTTQSLGGGYAAKSQTWSTNPGTGQPWTIADVNALTAGFELVDVSDTARVTQLYVTVALADRTTYVYSNGAIGMNQVTSLSTNGGAATTFGYDANGNLQSKFGTAKTCYAWNPENLLIQVKTVSAACTETGTQVQAYSYDGLGRRVRVDSAVSIFSGMDSIYEKDQSGAITKYVYANGIRIAKINPDSTVHYFLSDHQGSTRKILDASRVEQYSVDYEPFGKPYATSGPKPDPHKYTMEKRDDPTGLVYLRARQYDPDIGRFVSADPVLGKLSSPQTANRYAYVANNPLRFSDPSGECPNCIAALIGGIIGGLVGYVGCGIVTGGWTSSDCAIAGIAGAAAGALAGLTFGASLALMTGGEAAVGLAGLGASIAAGAASGAVYGATEYAVGGALRGDQLTAEGFGQAVFSGAVSGAIGGAAGFGVSRAWVKFNVGRFGRAFGQIQGASDIANAASEGDEHAFGVIRASLRLGPSRVTGFGGIGEPDIFVSGGMRNSMASWVEVKAGTVKPAQMYRYLNQFGPGEYALYNVPGTANPSAIGILKRAGIPYWYTW
jgi:RHS repeat-associated protein